MDPQKLLQANKCLLGVVHRTNIMRIVHEENYKEYRYCALMIIPHCYLQQCVAKPDFNWILFLHKSVFKQKCVLDLQNMHIWAQENSKCTYAHAHVHLEYIHAIYYLKKFDYTCVNYIMQIPSHDLTNLYVIGIAH